MAFSDDQKSDLNTVFNEATLIGAELDASTRRVGLTLGVVSLNPDGSVPDDGRIVVVLSPVGRLWASFRHGRWDDEKATAEPFTADRLLEVVQTFKALPIYGWDFFDCDESSEGRWKDRLSLDYDAGVDGRNHSLSLFQDGENKVLDLKIWFDDIAFFTPTYQRILIEDFIAGGKRAWDAIARKQDKKIQDAFGIYPLPPGYFDKRNV